jgi:protein arginine kinase activator
MPRKDKPEDLSFDKEPERPLECSECKKPISVFYTEIVGDMMVRVAHCSDCPVLKNKLYGMPYIEHAGSAMEISAGLACGNCGTTLEAIKLGTPLGCSNCYEVFDDILLQEMLAGNKAPPRLSAMKKSMPYHIGRGPGEVQEISPSLRLLALNEALNEMLKTEDYEQAAWLRDQIKALTEKNPEKSDERKQ